MKALVSTKTCCMGSFTLLGVPTFVFSLVNITVVVNGSVSGEGQQPFALH